jgi:hypothetical protein
VFGRLEWQSLPVTNTPVLYENSQITDKKFYNMGPKCQCYKIFFPSSLIMAQNKQECLLAADIFLVNLTSTAKACAHNNGVPDFTLTMGMLQALFKTLGLP